MKRFNFSLESVLKLRIQEEEDAKLALAERENELSHLNEELEEIKKNLNKFQDDEKVSRGQGYQSVDKLRQSVSWRHKFKTDISQKLGAIEAVKQDINIARKNLIEATKKRKGLDILKENQFKTWQKEYNRKEQIFLDELAQNMHLRGKANSEPQNHT
jgi:flagellar FliJ protein